MAAFTKPDGYVKQISIYLGSSDYAKAHALAFEMASVFPFEMISHFLLAKCALRLGRDEEALEHGRRALVMSKDRKDKLASSLLVATADYMLGRYADGVSVLREFEKDNDEDVERMEVLFAAAMGDELAAEMHVRELMKLNKKAAEDLIERFLTGKRESGKK